MHRTYLMRVSWRCPDLEYVSCHGSARHLGEGKLYLIAWKWPSRPPGRAADAVVEN
jgi:hypothetical protein